jgi:hypothetical protein
MCLHVKVNVKLCYLNYRVLHPVSSPDDALIRAETCREYRSYLIKYFINWCETEGITIYN